MAKPIKTLKLHYPIIIYFYNSWYTTPWSDCSKSCGNGQQTREVKCVMKVTSNEYEPSDNCSSNKTIITDTVRPCNSFACDPDWDTKEGLDVSILLWKREEGMSSFFCFTIHPPTPPTPHCCFNDITIQRRRTQTAR